MGRYGTESLMEREVASARRRFAAGEVLWLSDIERLRGFVTTDEEAAWHRRRLEEEGRLAAAAALERTEHQDFKRKLRAAGREQRSDKPRKVRL